LFAVVDASTKVYIQLIWFWFVCSCRTPYFV